MGELKPNMAASICKIRHVFMHDWDPIGVGDDLPEDEYDAYVMPMYSLLRQKRGEAAVLDYLEKVSERINGTPDSRDSLRDAASKFLQIDVSDDEIHR
jgi:hypothetical protein